MRSAAHRISGASGSMTHGEKSTRGLEPVELYGAIDFVAEHDRQEIMWRATR
jgi:hypothetical protein